MFFAAIEPRRPDLRGHALWRFAEHLPDISAPQNLTPLVHEHGPKKWVPVFREDHAQTRASTDPDQAESDDAIHDADAKGYETAAPGTMPPADAVAAMMKYNEALKQAGVLVALEGLHPPSMGARVSFADGKPVVTDGPFTEAREVIGGYWMIEVNSKDEAIAWATRCPASRSEVIEIRQVQEMSDFPADVQAAAAGLAEVQGTPRRRS